MSERHVHFDFGLNLGPDLVRNDRPPDRKAAGAPVGTPPQSNGLRRTVASVPASTSASGSGAFRPASGALERRARLPVLDAAVPESVARVAGEPNPTGCEPAWFIASAAEARWFVVPAGAQLSGVCCGHNVWVRGEVVGRVHATGGLLVLSPGSRVRGMVQADGEAVIAGQVLAGEGRCAIVAQGRLHLACTADVQGHVLHGVVAVYEGARVAGELRSACSARPPFTRWRWNGHRTAVRDAR